MDSLERSWYNLFLGHEIITAPNIPDYDFENRPWDVLILTGGGDSIARHYTENRLYALAESRAAPIIGFCHGAFAINDLAGGINGHVPDHVGQDHTVTMDNNIHQVNSFHSQNIARLAPGFESVAQSPDGWSEAFRHLFKPIWGVVWHPERQKKPVLPRDLADFLRTDHSQF